MSYELSGKEVDTDLANGGSHTDSERLRVVGKNAARILKHKPFIMEE